MPRMTHDLPEDAASPDATAPRARRRFRTAQDITIRRRRIMTAGLTVLLSVLLVNSLIGENGYLAAARARREHGRLLSALAQLRIENQQLQHESQRLRHEPAALEETARRELGLIKPGETMIIIRDAAPARPSAK